MMISKLKENMLIWIIQKYLASRRQFINKQITEEDPEREWTFLKTQIGACSLDPFTVDELERKRKKKYRR
jgi:aspartate/tyrosine/aromatic aminotransferase